MRRRSQASWFDLRRDQKNEITVNSRAARGDQAIDHEVGDIAGTKSPAAARPALERSESEEPKDKGRVGVAAAHRATVLRRDSPVARTTTVPSIFRFKRSSRPPRMGWRETRAPWCEASMRLALAIAGRSMAAVWPRWHFR